MAGRVNVEDYIYDFTESTGMLVLNKYDGFDTDIITPTIDGDIETYTFTVYPSPMDAIVVLTFPGYTQVGNSITVPKGSVVNYSVSKEGYTTVSDTALVMSDVDFPVSLSPAVQTYTLTITPTPSDATVTLTATGYTQVGNSITVPANTRVTYSVFKTGYITEDGYSIVTADDNIEVELQEEILNYYMLTISPNPSDAHVGFTTGTIAGNTTTVPAGTNVGYTVSKEGYRTITSYQVVNSDLILNIRLEEDTPSDMIHLQLLRGDTNKNIRYTGKLGELTYDIERKEVRVHDEVTPGGKVIGGGSGGNGDSIKNQNIAQGATDPLYDWEGTLAEYIAQDVEHLHPEWICFINDDVEGGDSVYTKSEVYNKNEVYNKLETYNKTQTYSKDEVDELIEHGGGGSGSYAGNILDVKWTDYILDDPRWLRSDTYEWYDELNYPTVYQHLSDDIIASIEAETNGQTETISGVTIHYDLAPDGHKIVNAHFEGVVEEVDQLFEATGSAWYYIFDPDNHRFKVPRTKYAFTGYRDAVGNYVEPGLPDHTHTVPMGKNDASGYHANGGYVPHVMGQTGQEWYSYKLNSKDSSKASVSNSIYGSSTTVQPPATQMYLYFYAGEFTAMIVDNPQELVHKNGTETIDGEKTFTSMLKIENNGTLSAIKIQNIPITEGQHFQDITGYDTEEARIGGVRFEKTQDNHRAMTIYACDENNTNRGGIRVSCESSGSSIRTYAMKPASDVSYYDSDIVTTDWINQNRTNCLTKIPQDIKLELSNGELKIKAGSKIWMPDGIENDEKRFTYQEITEDLTIYATGGTGMCVCVLWINDSTGKFGGGNSTNINNCKSGDSSTIMPTYSLLYNTETNYIYRYNGTLDSFDRCSFPICIQKQTDGTIQSIEQTFNGFGYIGGVYYCLPGVSAMIPNGRNDDGTMKNTSFTVENVLTYEVIAGTHVDQSIRLSKTSITSGDMIYDEEMNINYIGTRSDPSSKRNSASVGRYSCSDGKITRFAPDSVCHYIHAGELTTTLIEAIYPVGSLYMGAQESCPISLLIPNSTWEKVGTSLVTNITNATIKGNGSDIHIHTTSGGNANRDARLRFNNNECLELASYDGWHDQYDTNVVYFGDLNNKNVGLTLDAGSSSITINIWKRTA